MNVRSFLWLAVLALGGILAGAAADERTSASKATSSGEWPQWRGAGRDGSVSSPEISWPDQLTLLWERDVGAGYSGPVGGGDRVYVHTRQGEQEVVSSLDLADGKPMWSRRYSAVFTQDDSALKHGRGPYSTPALADGRLFTYSVTGVFSVWDAATGELSWRRSSADEFDPSFPFFGAAASPLVDGEVCFIHLGGGHDRSLAVPSWSGAMVALRVADGSELWRWAGDGPALAASPVIAVVEGRRQLILKSLENVVGLDAGSGEELWRIPFKVSEDNTIVTPLWVDDRLVVSDWEKGMSAWRIRSRDGAWVAEELWKNSRMSLSMSSPVAVAGQIVGFAHYRMGQLFGLDPDTGETLWEGARRSGEYASLLAWNDELLVFRDDGKLFVGELTRDGFRPVGEYPLGDEGLWAHPAVVEGRLLVKVGSRLKVYRAELRNET